MDRYGGGAVCSVVSVHSNILSLLPVLPESHSYTSTQHVEHWKNVEINRKTLQIGKCHVD